MLVSSIEIHLHKQTREKKRSTYTINGFSIILSHSLRYTSFVTFVSDLSYEETVEKEFLGKSLIDFNYTRKILNKQM